MTGPNVEVYGLVRGRDRATLERFVERRIDVAATDRRGFFNVFPADEPEADMSRFPDFASVIEVGLTSPREAFYSDPAARGDDVDGASLGFTRDGGMVFGLVICEPLRPRWVEVYQALVDELLTEHSCYAVVVTVEEPPPMDERELRAMVEGTAEGPVIVLDWRGENLPPPPAPPEQSSLFGQLVGGPPSAPATRSGRWRRHLDRLLGLLLLAWLGASLLSLFGPDP